MSSLMQKLISRSGRGVIVLRSTDLSSLFLYRCVSKKRRWLIADDRLGVQLIEDKIVNDPWLV